jgi:sugar (pentulose or hexulose) kinase
MTAQHGCFLGVDAGTTAYKGVLTDPDARVIATAETRTTYDYPAPGRVESSAAACLAPVEALIRELAAAAPAPVLALAISGAAGSTLNIDADGRAGNVISWLDTRSAGHPPAPLAGLDAPAVRTVTGWPCVDCFPLAQLGWRREHRPETLDRAAWIGLNTDFMQFQLSGRHALDFSTATTLHLVDQRRRDYSEELLGRLGIRRAQLSELVDPGRVIGPVTPEAAARFGLSPETLVVAGSFDHPSAALGAGVTAPGELLLSCGTSFVGFMPVAQRETIMAEPSLLCDPFLSSENGPWGAIFSVTALGRRIDDLVLRFIAPGHEQPFAEFDRLARHAAERGTGGTLDLERDYEKSPLPDRAELALAVMNGAAAALAVHVDRLRAAGFRLTRGKLAGGICRSAIFPAIIARRTGLELEMLSGHAGARGAALWAAKGYESL